ncbi:MAG TPA: DUF5074 domain-containing protein [Bacteroidales bacterium]|nr:DUF5074 domain-containing protein [Bacteroidales bacterium]
MKKLLFIITCVITVSCLPFERQEDIYNLSGGVIIVNEGTFNAGNGSLSFYSYDSSKVFNDLFYSTNGRPLGDVPNSVNVFNGRAYIVVNNSGKIEVVDPSTFRSKGTISNLTSPRNIAFVRTNKAYVTSLWSDSVTIVDPENFSVSGYINIGKSSESILIVGNKAFISNWMGGNEIIVINTLTDEVIGSIEVGAEPESMTIDRNLRLWVLCTGGYQKLQNAELDVIDINSLSVIKKFVFPSSTNSPSCLRIDGSLQTLYYIDNGIMKMDIAAESLPVAPFIPQNNETFYKLAINPVNNFVLVTDATNFVTNGFLRIYDERGFFVSCDETGVTPGEMSFVIDVTYYK